MFRLVAFRFFGLGGWVGQEGLNTFPSIVLLMLRFRHHNGNQDER